MRGLVWTLVVLLFLSLATNVFFISGRGVHITNRYEQIQNQQQAQLVLGLCSSQGEIRWTIAAPDEIVSFLDSLSPEQALFAKITRNRVFYPQFQPPESEEEAPHRMNAQTILQRR